MTRVNRRMSAVHVLVSKKAQKRVQQINYVSKYFNFKINSEFSLQSQLFHSNPP